MTTVRYVANPEPYGDEIRELLVATQDEFVPPLASREGTTQTRGLDETREGTIDAYYEQLIDQSFIVALDDGVAGFLSFRSGYRTDELGEFVPSNYVSTIVVGPDHRRKGYARLMYRTLLSDLPAELRQPYVTTRTWSTNASHLALLDDLGFERLTVIPDDRGDGVDTVYLGAKTADAGGRETAE